MGGGYGNPSQDNFRFCGRFGGPGDIDYPLDSIFTHANVEAIALAFKESHNPPQEAGDTRCLADRSTLCFSLVARTSSLEPQNTRINLLLGVSLFLR